MEDARIATVMDNLRELGLTQTIVSDPWSISYLTGYKNDPGERFFALLLREGCEPTLFLNRLFPDAVHTGVRVIGYSDTDDIIALVAGEVDAAAELGVDKELAARWLVPMMERGIAAGYRLGSPAVDGARAIKDERERELMRAASRMNDEGMKWLFSQVREGVTEIEIAEGLLGEYRRLGADDFSFPPIVSFGANAADPHHSPDATRLERGQVVLFDVGCLSRGYCADMTRTFFFGEPSKRDREVYECVRRANEAAEAIVRPGVTFSEIDLTARRIIEDAGYGPYFTHRLGHQIGTQVHEPGDVSATHHEPVREGMIFSIEPGIYLEGEMGVRIEDLVLVTADGCEVLNSYPKGITVIEPSR